MRVLEDDNKCYGCYACQNICPVGAISMELDNEGFYKPVIDNNKCIHCDRCREACPSLHPAYPNDNNPETYAVMASDELRMQSSSGAMFSILAEYILGRGGVVCGCAFVDTEAKHIIIDNKEELYKLRRSKYVQSRIGECYKKTSEYLKADRQVLFSGTPCQIAGLYSFLKTSNTDISGLLTVDVICHSAPSPKIWDIYLNSVADKTRELVDINFRTKKYGWVGRHTITLTYADGIEQDIKFDDSLYTQGFIKNLINRKSCQTCQFSCIPRQGDFTLSDFWGVSSYDKTLNDNKGTSAVFLNNEKARKIFEEIDKSVLKKFALLNKEAVAVRNSGLYKRPWINFYREDYIAKVIEANTLDIDKSDLKSDLYDVGIVSWFYAKNFGAVLTSYALVKAIEELGYTCTLLDVPDQVWAGSESARNPFSFMKRFIYKNCNVMDAMDLNDADSIAKVNGKCRGFVVGSDQLWRYEKIKGREDFYFLGFANKDKAKFAYATSFGGNTFACDDEKKLSEVKELISQFNGVSVRENNGVDVCKNILGVEAEFVLDPVFLCEKKYYDQVASFSHVKPGKYVVAYIIAYSKEKEEALIEIGRKLNREILVIPNGGELAEDTWSIPVITDIQMEDFLWYIKNADYVLTDSFHAACFSIIFGTQFVATTEGRAGKNRYSSLLSTLNIKERMVKSFDEVLEDISILTNEIDFASVQKLLYRERIKSLYFLEKQLALTRKKPISKDDSIKKDSAYIYDLVRNNPEEYVLIAANHGKMENISKYKFAKFMGIGPISRENMKKGFEYIYDGATKEIKRFFTSEKTIKYAVDNGDIIGIEAPETEFFVKDKSKTLSYICDEQGLYIVLYSRSKRKIIAISIQK